MNIVLLLPQPISSSPYGQLGSPSHTNVELTMTTDSVHAKKSANGNFHSKKKQQELVIHISTLHPRITYKSICEIVLVNSFLVIGSEKTHFFNNKFFFFLPSGSL